MLELTTSEKFEQLKQLLVTMQADTLESDSTKHVGLLLNIAIEKLDDICASVVSG